jgi:hypothetical protein
VRVGLVVVVVAVMDGRFGKERCGMEDSAGFL